MGWEDQGRQAHGWFGDGTTMQTGDEPDPATVRLSFDQRVDAIAHSVVAQLPPSSRDRAALIFDGPTLRKLRQAMAAWAGASALDRDRFRQRFLDQRTSDQTVDLLCSAAQGVQAARSHADLTAPGADLAGAMQQIGLDRWTAYLSDAADRAGRADDTERRYMADPSAFHQRNMAYGDNYECVSLVRKLTGAPQTRTWMAGEVVKGNIIAPGTAIATFDSNGHYRGHAALYISQDKFALHVFDQWASRKQPPRRYQPPHFRPIWFKGGHADPSNDGDQFHVVVTK